MFPLTKTLPGSFRKQTIFSSLGKISLELREHHPDKVIPSLKTCLFTPAVLVRLINITIKNNTTHPRIKKPNQYKFPCYVYDYDEKMELEQRLKQLGRGPAALGSALSWKSPRLPANQTPNFTAGLLLFTEIFEMLNSPESCKLPGQEQCQTEKCGRHGAKPANPTPARETPFRLAKNQNNLSKGGHGAVTPGLPAAACSFLLGNRSSVIVQLLLSRNNSCFI